MNTLGLIHVPIEEHTLTVATELQKKVLICLKFLFNYAKKASHSECF
jgi:hypothetical protein